MNRFDELREAVRCEALAAAWNSRAKELRAKVEAEAVAEYRANGNGVTWTMRDLGRVTLPLTNEAPYIDDIDALLKWCKQRHPEQVQTVEQVYAAFQAWLLKNARVDGEVVVDPETGEIIPGMAVREGGKPKPLTISVDKPVKDLFAAYARDEVARQLAAEYGTQESSVSDPDGA